MGFDLILNKKMPTYFNQHLITFGRVEIWHFLFGLSCNAYNFLHFTGKNFHECYEDFRLYYWEQIVVDLGQLSVRYLHIGTSRWLLDFYNYINSNPCFSLKNSPPLDYPLLTCKKFMRSVEGVIAMRQNFT